MVTDLLKKIYRDREWTKLMGAGAISIVVSLSSFLAVQAHPLEVGKAVRQGQFIPRVIPVSNDIPPQEPDTIMMAAMPGKCSTLKVEGRDFACRAVAYYQTEEGRGNFVFALDDPNDDRHIVIFSGDNGRKPTDTLFELPIDRMLLKSQDRPKADGLPVPLVESSAGLCKLVGNFVTRQVATISCSATAKDGKKYELQFESDNTPISVTRVKRSRAGRPTVSPFDQGPE